MNLVFIIKNRDETPFMVVRTTPNGSTFEPMSDSAKDLAKMLRQEYGKTPITKPELVQTMDASKIIEGPSPSGTATQKKVANISIVGKELQALPVLSISEVLLSEFSDEEFKNVLTFKASSFISDQTRSSAHFEIKGVRAIWDPSLSIPGTNRRGGFRCPVGTRYGGQITDRFGRSCGWGVARRIANQIADIGERLEQRDDDKRKRRLDRRNARMIRRLGGVAETGRVEGGLRNVAERLEGGKPQQRRRGRRGLAELGQEIFLDDIRPGSVLDRARNRVVEVLRPEDGAQTEVNSPSVRTPRNRRRDVIPETAPTPTPKPRPARRPAPAGRRPQPRPRVAPQPENVDVLTAREASDANASEDFKPYVLRKYDEYAKRVREIRAGGGNAGMLTRREWYAINKENLRDAWKDAHGRSAPQDFEPPKPQARRPRNNRRRRRQATAQGAGRAATRRPTPDDVPEPAPARPVRPARPARRPRRQPDGRGFVTPGDGRDPIPQAPESARPAPAGTPLAPEASQKSPLRRFKRKGNPHGVLPIDRSDGGMGKFQPAEDPNINSKEKAIEHIRNGGDLGKVPPQYMFDALLANSSKDETDMNARFRAVDPTGGAIGFTQLFFLRGADGKKTNQGWVFKAAREEDNVGELIGWNYLAALKMIEDGAIVDGRVPVASQDVLDKLDARNRRRIANAQGKQFVVTPMAFNDVPNDHKIGPNNNGDFVVSQLRKAPDRGIPARVGNLLANFVLGVSDRHAGNGIGRIVTLPDGSKKAIAIPIDLGWAGFQHRTPFMNYERGFGMDSNLIVGGEAAAELRRIPDLNLRRKAYRDTLRTFDEIETRTRQIINKGRATFVQEALKNITNPSPVERRKAEQVFDGMQTALGELSQQRQRIVDLLPVGER